MNLRNLLVERSLLPFEDLFEKSPNLVTSQTQTLLKRHMNEIHKGSEWHCQEPGCGQSFRRERNLKQHLNTHLAIKPYQCLWCDFTGEGKQV